MALPEYHFDHSTPEGRAAHWKAWNSAPKHMRNLIGWPPCWTCGGIATGRFQDGSPLFNHFHPAKDHPRCSTTTIPT